MIYKFIERRVFELISEESDKIKFFCCALSKK